MDSPLRPRQLRGKGFEDISSLQGVFKCPYRRKKAHPCAQRGHSLVSEPYRNIKNMKNSVVPDIAGINGAIKIAMATIDRLITRFVMFLFSLF